MKKKKMVIIGGGVAGLSAGIFGRINGFDTVVLEKNSTPGGQCTGWDRKGYYIDGCIHWLTGTLEGTPMNDLWKRLGALDGVEIYHPESFLVFEHPEGNVVYHRDLERLRQGLLDLAPADTEAINAFCRDLQKLQSLEMPIDKPMDLKSIPEKIRYFLSMKDAGPVLQKYLKTPVGDFARQFSHPALRAALASQVPEDYSSLAIVFALAFFTKGQASIPYGGSRAFALRMAERYRSLGGVLHTSCEASALDFEGSRVTAVKSSDGRRFEADYIVAACDAKVLYERLLGGRYPDKAYEKRFADPQAYPLASEIMVSIGCAGTAEALPHTLSFPAANPVSIHGRRIDRLQITCHGHETGWAPEGHTLITCDINQFGGDWEAWERLYSDRPAYRAEKARIGREVLENLEQRFPEMRGKLEVLDVVSPKTWERWCNAHRGAFMSFMMTTKGKMLDHPGTIRGIPNLFLSGQWLQPPGGLPVAAVTGKDTVMRICRREKQEFRG
jgi:phytoene desaturase